MTTSSRVNAPAPSQWSPLGNALGIAGASERQTTARERRLVAAAVMSPLTTPESDPLTAQLLGIIAKANTQEGGKPRRADFNVELLWPSLDPSMRARLAWALQSLVAGGLLRKRAGGEYSVVDPTAIVSQVL